MILNFKACQRAYFGLIVTVVILAGIFIVEDDKISTDVFSEDSGKVLIIDPGHGGADGGATSINGVEESEINLAIGLKAAAICDFTGINYAMTRDSEDIEYEEGQSIGEKKRYDQKKRVEFINSHPNAVLVSLHQNFYIHPDPFGPQVFYGMQKGGEELGKILQENLNKALCPENRRVAAPISEKIYLMKKVNCPAVLVECGFISNPQEADLLIKDTYRLKIAFVLIGSYLSLNKG